MNVEDTERIDLSRIHQQRNQFLKVIEELRYITSTNKNLEEKLKAEIKEKIKLQGNLESVSSHLFKSQANCEALEKRLKDYTESVNNEESLAEVADVNKLKVALEAAELTIDGLKQHVIQQNAARCDLERRFVELENKLSAKQKLTDKIVGATGTFQATVDKLSSQLEQTTEAQTYLEHNITAVNQQNEKLVHAVEHQQIVIQSLEKDRENLRVKVIDLEQRLRSATHFAHQSISETGMLTMQSQISRLERELELSAAARTFLESELNDCRSELTDAVQVARNMQKLLKRTESCFKSGVVIEAETESRLKQDVEPAVTNIDECESTSADTPQGTTAMETTGAATKDMVNIQLPEQHVD